MVNLFGHGYVGKEFAFKFATFIQDRNDLMPKKDCDQILYMISTVDNYHVKVNPYIDVETNLTTLIRVLENFRIHNPTAVFNFVSSWFVYGDTELPAKETSYCNPKGFYSITKRTAEQLLISYCETYNLKYRILRLANVIGGNDTKVSKRKNALTYLINELKNDREIGLYDGGDFFRDYIHISDVVNAIDIVLRKGETNEIYNISNGVATRFNDLMIYVGKKLNKRHLIKNIEQAEFHKVVQVKSMYMENNKLLGLGYVQKKFIVDCLEEIINK
ncbi:MAG: SDR family oxidoreductase [Proteobacteria bacterium]|nr:SDR family oxidoreductase [Pseudomonadota bacterium]NBP14460.1 SDR family oxidoreductase [bacterium]